jgi:hypothetical protein
MPAALPALLLVILALRRSSAAVALASVRAPAYPLFVHSPFTSWWGAHLLVGHVDSCWLLLAGLRNMFLLPQF